MFYVLMVVISFTSLILISRLAHATDVLFDIGPGFKQAPAAYIGLTFPTKWQAFDVLDINIESGVLVTKGGEIIDITPMFNYGKHWYSEAGVGLSLASGRNFDQRQENGVINFRDVLGIGYHFADKWTVGIRFNHYSNGGKANPVFGKEPNAGYSWAMLHITRPF